MGSFFEPFSDSFITALGMWPITSLALTGPFIIWRIITAQRATWTFALFSYAFVLYGLGLILFTLYPMPDNPSLYCSTRQLQPQLIPFHWITDILDPATRISGALQVLCNVLFFVPFGVFLMTYFNIRFKLAIVIGFLASLGIELAQLTGIFGIYPCSFRLFDIDDLAINTLGTMLGYLAAYRIGYRVDASHLSAPHVPSNRRNMMLAGCIDMFMIILLSFITQLVIHFTIARPLAPELYNLVYPFWIGVWLYGIPAIFSGWTLGRYLVGIDYKKVSHPQKSWRARKK